MPNLFDTVAQLNLIAAAMKKCPCGATIPMTTKGNLCPACAKKKMSGSIEAGGPGSGRKPDMTVLDSPQMRRQRNMRPDLFEPKNKGGRPKNITQNQNAKASKAQALSDKHSAKSQFHYEKADHLEDSLGEKHSASKEAQAEKHGDLSDLHESAATHFSNASKAYKKGNDAVGDSYMTRGQNTVTKIKNYKN